MSLTIIAASKIETMVLNQAFSDVPFDIKTYISCADVTLSQDDMFYLATATSENLPEIQKMAQQAPVFLITDDGMDVGKDYEEVFMRPIRLGNVMESIRQAIDQHNMHKALEPITMGFLILDPKTAFLKDINKNVSVRLTEKELAIILLLYQNQGTAISRDALLNEIWGYAKDIETHTLETHLYRLRQKIQIQLGLQNFLVTQDDGYILVY